MEEWKIEKYEVVGMGLRHQKRIQESLDIISQIMTIAQRPYIACSFGKDSSVMAHLILSYYPNVPLRFLSSGETRIIHPNLDEVMDYFRKMGAEIIEINIDRVFSEEWKDATWYEQRQAGHNDFKKHLSDSGGYDCVFMGLRAEESKRREMSLLRHTPGLPRFCYQYKGKNLIRCCPMARWTTEDIGAYILEHNIPYLKWYDHTGFEGRTTARLTRASIEMGSLRWIRLHNPDGWKKLVKRFPEFQAMM